MKTVCMIALLCLFGCKPAVESQLAGDPERGRQLLGQYGCNSCHRIPGVAGTYGNVGPPLGDLSRRVYLAGVLPNSFDNLVRWIRAPQAIAPGTAMPDLKVTEQQARDMAAFLYEGSAQ